MRLFSIAMLALPLLLAFTGVAAEDLTQEQKERLIAAVGKKLSNKAYAFETDFSKWKNLVELRSTEISAARSKNELAAVLNGALAEFKLSHLGLFSPSTVMQKRRGTRNGMGVTLHPRDEGGALVGYVLKDSPAERCGLEKGDILKSIDGEPLTDFSQLAGEIGQKRVLSWTRNSKPMSAEITYAEFSGSEPSQMRWLNEDVALIQIQSFQYRFYKAARVNKFFRQARNAEAIVIDLRNNRGGLSFYSRHLASKVASAREVYAVLARRRHESRSNGKAIYPLPLSNPYSGKIVVLVDSLSASAADIFPAFISESGRGIVIGERTSGALQLARSFPLPDGFRIYLPIAELLTPGGERLEAKGFKPDIELSLEETIDDRTILETALRAIETDQPLSE